MNNIFKLMSLFGYCNKCGKKDGCEHLETDHYSYPGFVEYRINGVLVDKFKFESEFDKKK